MGWLHLPPREAQRRATGLLICAPLGYDALCAHRSLRHFAESAAARGFPSLRFDYDGTGDSAGAVDDPARWDAWRESIRLAVGALKEGAGVEQVVLLGIGLGATLAATVAGDHADIRGVAAIAPIISGRAWLREQRALKGVMGRALAPRELALPEGTDESVGLLITPDLRAALEQVDLAQVLQGQAREWLVLDRDDRPAASSALVEALEAKGATVQNASVPGYVQMMQDPHESELPVELIARTTDWLMQRFPASAAGAGRDVLGPGPAVVAKGIEELPVRLGESPALFGVLTRTIGSRPTRAVVFLNAGSNHHIGNGRMYVEYARRLAAKGFLVLRYDVSGIGESRAHEGRPENEVYTAMAVRDLAAAVAFLRERQGAKQVEAAGLCSGAYHALRGAIEGVPLDAAVVINPLTFRWRDGMSLKYPPFMVAQTAAQYKASMRDWRKWMKVLRGGVDLRLAGAVAAKRAQTRAGVVVRDLRRALGTPAPHDLGTELQGVAARGVRVHFVFSVGDPGESLLRSGAGRAFARLHRQGQISVAHLPGADHSLSMSWMRTLLWNELDRRFGAP